MRWAWLDHGKTMPVALHSLLKSELCVFKGKIHICTWNASYVSAPGWQVMTAAKMSCLPVKAPAYVHCVCLIIISTLFHSSKSVPVWMKNYMATLLTEDKPQFYRFLISLEATKFPPVRDRKQFPFNIPSILTNIYWVPNIYPVLWKTLKDKMLHQKFSFWERLSVKVYRNLSSDWNLWIPQAPAVFS